MVSYSRTGNTVTLTVTVDAGDLLAGTDPKDTKLVSVFRRAATQLDDLQRVHLGRQANITNQIAALQTEAKSLPAPVATF